MRVSTYVGVTISINKEALRVLKGKVNLIIKCGFMEIECINENIHGQKIVLSDKLT